MGGVARQGDVYVFGGTHMRLTSEITEEGIIIRHYDEEAEEEDGSSKSKAVVRRNKDRDRKEAGRNPHRRPRSFACHYRG